jgi:peptidoglycan/xylan/chitin deacetylase (PgdA/CDA1 family)
VKPRHFTEHLEIVKKKCSPLSLKGLVSAFQGKTLPRHPVVVTFDDGYADNFTDAKPLLERYAIPATIFVTAGYVGSDREFWWDELERLILEPAHLPETLDLDKVNGGSFTWNLGREKLYKADAYHSWNVQSRKTPLHAMASIASCELLRPLRNSAGATYWTTCKVGRTGSAGRLTPCRWH